jgi:hypothetical protein
VPWRGMPPLLFLPLLPEPLAWARCGCCLPLGPRLAFPDWDCLLESLGQLCHSLQLADIRLDVWARSLQWSGWQNLHPSMLHSSLPLQRFLQIRSALGFAAAGGGADEGRGADLAADAGVSICESSKISRCALS